MKRKIKLFNGLLTILLAVGFVAAQTTTSTKTQTLDRKQAVTENDTPKFEIKSVALKFEDGTLLGIRSLAGRGTLAKNELEAKAVTDGASMVLALDEKNFAKLEQPEALVVKSEILLCEETSKYLGSNVYSLLDGEYKFETSKNFSVIGGPRHSRLRTFFNPGGEHRFFNSYLKTDNLRLVEIETASTPTGKDYSKPVLVLIRDGTIASIKMPDGSENINDANVFRAKASYQNNALILEFERPISNERRAQLKTDGKIIANEETSEYLGKVCGCAQGIYPVTNASSRGSIITIPVVVARHHHRWLFRRTSYIVDSCTIGWGAE